MTTPTTIAAAETGLLARLQAKLEHFAIESFPDKPDNYKLTHQRGAFLVQYRGADHSPSELADAATDRGMHWDITVLARSLAGAESAYVMIESARAVLAGFAIPGFSRIIPMRERFVGRGEGLWIYALTISMATLSIPADDEDLGPLLEQITAVSSFDTTQVP